MHPLEDLKVVAVHRTRVRMRVPRAAVGAGPLEDLEVAVCRRAIAHICAPRAAVGARPLEDLEVAVLRRESARVFVPRAAVGARPLEDLEVAVLHRVRARLLVPRAAVGAQPLQDLYPTLRCSMVARIAFTSVIAAYTRTRFVFRWYQTRVSTTRKVKRNLPLTELLKQLVWNTFKDINNSSCPCRHALFGATKRECDAQLLDPGET